MRTLHLLAPLSGCLCLCLGLTAALAACDHAAANANASSAPDAVPGTGSDSPPPASTNAAAAPNEEEPAAAGEDQGKEQGSEGDEPTLPAAPKRAIADNTSRALLAEIDRELGAMRSSSYTHHTAVDEATGTFDFDCSGFVGYALEGSAPSAFDELRAATAKRPLAKHFEAFFASLPSASAPHWERVPKVSELQPGDIIAWLKVPGSSSKNTGHVVIVHGAVQPENGHPGSYLVPIADSTSLHHGRQDSRYAAKTTGLGTGTLVMVADESGAPVAYRWSRGKKSRELATAFAMARLSGR